MKKIKLLTMALAALAIFSCSKEDANKNVAPDTPGQPVFAQFSISLPSATRAGATGDTHGTTAENAINDIKVYVIGSNRLVETILEVPAISGTNNTYATQIIKTTTGSKEVIAVVNGASRPAAQFKVGDNLTKIQDALIENVAAATGTDVLFTNRPVSVEVVNKNSTNGGTTTDTDPFKISVSVDRAVAKVVVRNGISTIPSLGTIEVTSPQFAINGLVSNAGLFQVGTALLPANHGSAVHNFWTSGVADPAKMTAYGNIAAIGTATTAIGGDGTQGGLYTLENVVGATTKNQEGTMIYVKLVLLPKTKYTTTTIGDGADVDLTKGYYAVKSTTESKYIFFETEQLFTAWKNAASVDVAKYNDAGVFYTGGENYYRVNIMNDATNADLKYSVLRNKLYDITLKEIRNFGKNTDADLVVPTEPIETNAFINAEITINNWEYKPQESNLE